MPALAEYRQRCVVHHGEPQRRVYTHELHARRPIMGQAWCILVLLACIPLLVVAAGTDVPAAPSEQRLAQSLHERVVTRERGTTHQETIAQSLPAPTRLSITESVVSQAPPPPRTEMIPFAPLPSSVWVPGYWAWNSGWQWVTGHWAQPPQGATTWVPGQWVPQGQYWVWRPGHWQ